MAEDRHEIQVGTDESTNRPYQLVSVELTKQDVEAELADLGEYSCQCYAFGSGQDEDEGVVSEVAKIRIACEFLNFLFEYGF